MRGREQHLGAGSAVLEFILKINYQPFKIDRKWQRMQIGISQKKKIKTWPVNIRLEAQLLS